MTKTGNYLIWIVGIFFSLLAIVFSFPAKSSEPLIDGLEKNFRLPPDEAKPWVSMWWFDTITTENITQHLVELKAKGIGGALLIDLNAMPGVPFLSESWLKLFSHTLEEADRLGLKIASNVCSVWPSGGSWITLENSSWMPITSTTMIEGPQQFSGRLTDPPGKGRLYKDFSVQAFPVSEANNLPEPVISVSGNAGQIPHLLDGNYNTAWKSGAGNPWIMADFGCSRTVDWIWTDVAGTITIEASEDSLAFFPVFEGYAPFWHNVIFEAIPSTKARWFKINVPENSDIRDFAIGTRKEVERFALMAAKRGHTNPLGVTGTPLEDQMNFVRKDLNKMPGDSPLESDKMIDLTSRLDSGGFLNWEVPDGNWKVIRIGQTTTGIQCGDGLLTDYLSKKATEQNFQEALKKILDVAGPLTGKTFLYFREDNVETGGMFSWTPGFLKKFKKRRGYDPTRYLSALADEIVESTEITDRFLADWRRTIADCVADNHYGHTAALLNDRGVKYRAEAGGQFHPRLLSGDGLMNLGRIDIPEAEFWENSFWKENQADFRNHHEKVPEGWDEKAQNVNAKQAASAAHLYGKKTTGSEAFTSVGSLTHWGIAPADLLLYGNIAFCEGINAFNIHGSATSGPRDGKPGKVFAAGTHFNHNVTWWDMAARPFVMWLTRCQYMLRQGLFVADVLFYNGDEVPNFVPPKNINPSLGFGYDYDVCNTEVLLKRLSVKDGLIVLPDGMSYRMLVLPERAVMPLKAARKIEELINAGATVIGPNPIRTPGLEGYPQSEHELKEIGEKLWNRQQWGKGRVFDGPSISEVLKKDGIGPDFFYASETQDALLDFIHRRKGDTDIYFIANRRGKTTKARCQFRVKGKQPEIWNPMTGEIRMAGEFYESDKGIELPLEFSPYGSWFIIFRKAGENGIKRGPVGNYRELKQVMELTGSWDVSFDSAWGGPQMVHFDSLMSWTSRTEDGIRYYSGKAVYKKRFDVSFKIAEEEKLILDLGNVKNVARVRLNGHDLGVVWYNPFRVDVSGKIKSEGNSLEVEVVNLWRNRLIGDQGLPEEKRLTHTKIRIGSQGKLLDSGLLGPVILQTERR